MHSRRDGKEYRDGDRHIDWRSAGSHEPRESAWPRHDRGDGNDVPSLTVAGKDRAARVSIADNGDSVDVRVDTDGDTGNGFGLLVVTLNTADAVTVGSDVVLGS